MTLKNFEADIRVCIFQNQSVWKNVNLEEMEINLPNI